MADWAGAVAAIRATLVAEWTTTPIAFQNEKFDPASDAVDDDSAPVPWVYLEVLGQLADIITFGRPGALGYLYEGEILVHVFVPKDSGTAIAQQYVVAVGEIFRTRGDIYDNGNGTFLRTRSPKPLGGGQQSDDGNWFSLIASIPFEFFYRG